MKNFKYVTLASLLLASLTAGCNHPWNPFRKKEPAQPPLANVAPMDNTAATDAPRPDGVVTVVEAPAGTNTATAGGTADTTPVAAPSGGTSYTIKKKDTLWSIAVKHLGDGQRYREIIAANPGLDPKKLAVGQTIKIPPK